MSVINAVPLLEAAGGGDYTIARSVRLRSSASAYLSRTPTTTTATRTAWTYSAWVKLGQFTSTLTYNTIFSTGTSSSNYMSINFTNCTANDQLVVNADGYQKYYTSAVFRDPAAWYHVVVTFNSNAAAGSRIVMYINGVQQTSNVNNEISSGYSSPFGVSTNPMYMGRHGSNAGWTTWFYADDYITEVNWIDGQALTPSSFGSTNAITGVWQPIKYTGTYGTNGFYLNFSDNSAATATAIGKDLSGNANNWTPNNISVTAGVTYDSMTDVPTLTSATAANYAVMNPLSTGSNITLSNANLTTTQNGSAGISKATFAVSSGKWYWEFTLTSGTSCSVGIAKDTALPTTTYVGYSSDTWGYQSVNGKSYNNIAGGSSAQVYGATWTTNDVIGMALDLDAGTLVFYKNGTSQGTAFSSLSG